MDQVLTGTGAYNVARAGASGEGAFLLVGGGHFGGWGGVVWGGDKEFVIKS